MGWAISGVPAKTRRVAGVAARLEREPVGGVRALLHRGGGRAGPLGLAHGPQGELALLAVEAVDEEHAVEVVGLVLYAAGQQGAALDRDRVPELVLALGDHPHRPLR